VTTRERIIYLAKASIARGLYTVGLLQLWQAVALRRKAVVLMYHRVLSDSERRRSASNPALIVGRETFAMHMRVLKRRFSVISVDELVDRMERRTPFRDSSCLITFDDGWCDNFTNALPSLREHGHPALVFLPINYIGTQRMFWQETLTHLLLAVVRSVERNPARKGRFAELLAPVGLEWVTELGGEDAHRAILPGVDEQKRTARHVVTELSAALVAELGFPLAEAAQADGFMTWDQVEAMSRDRVTSGDTAWSICSSRRCPWRRCGPRFATRGRPSPRGSMARRRRSATRTATRTRRSKTKSDRPAIAWHSSPAGGT
jgi:hypothetical protein